MHRLIRKRVFSDGGKREYNQMWSGKSMNKRGRVCIVGFDSLDYYLVVKYNLRYLMQKEYGKVEINVGVLSTPTIWTSFITGLPPEEHGVIGWKWKNPVLDKLKRKAVKIGLNKITFDRSMFLTQLVRKRIKGDVPNIKGRIPTIFDYSRSPVDINVPCYSEDAYEEQRHEIAYGSYRTSFNIFCGTAKTRLENCTWKWMRQLTLLKNVWVKTRSSFLSAITDKRGDYTLLTVSTPAIRSLTSTNPRSPILPTS